SGSTIEIVSPKPDQIFAPGSTVTIETISRLKGGRLKEVSISGAGIDIDQQSGPPRMELVSNQGNVYRHRFVVKDVPAASVYSHFNVYLVEDSGGYADAEVGFLVRDLPKIVLKSIRDGQTLPKAEKILLTFDGVHPSMSEQYTLYIDGKSHSDLSSDSIYWLN